MGATTKEEYFDQALVLLAESGATGVTIANLCAGLEVTKGSFYHHFESRSDFFEAFLMHWEHKYASVGVDNAREVLDPIERLNFMKPLVVGFHHEAETAIRALARTDEAAAAAQSRVDAERIRIVEETLIDVGIDAPQASDLAHTAVSMLIGAQHISQPADRERMARQFDGFEWWLHTVAARVARNQS